MDAQDPGIDDVILRAKELGRLIARCRRPADPTLVDVPLKELRDLHRQIPGNPELTHIFVAALSSARAIAAFQGDPERTLAFLEEIRAKQRENPDDEKLRKYLGRSLSGTCIFGKGDALEGMRRAFIDELRSVNEEFPDSSNIRQSLGSALQKQVERAARSGDLPGTDCWLEELRNVVQQHPSDQGIRGCLKNALGSVFLNALRVWDDGWTDDALNELRRLCYDPADGEGPIGLLATYLIFGDEIAVGIGDWDRARCLRRELREIYDLGPRSNYSMSFLRRAFGRAYYIAHDLGEADEAEAILGELRELCEGEGRDDALVVAFGGALLEMWESFRWYKNEAAMSQSIERVKELFHENPDSDGLRHVMGGAILKAVRRASDREEALRLMSEFYAVMRLVKPRAKGKEIRVLARKGSRELPEEPLTNGSDTRLDWDSVVRQWEISDEELAQLRATGE